MSELRCPNCGEHPTLRSGDSLTFTTRITSGADGGFEEPEDIAAWCPDCVREWNERIESSGDSEQEKP